MANFEVTFDYLCPFARNANEAVASYIKGSGRHAIGFRAFSLNQAHIPEGEAPVWHREPTEWGAGVTALLYGIAVRDSFPDQFLDFHVAAFALRHDQGLKYDEPGLQAVASSVGIDVDVLTKEVWSGVPLTTLEFEHTEAVERWSVFGVPTFISGEEAVFIRFMERNHVPDLERALELVEWSRLNEFKRTRISR
jgi:hypothetical protein